MRKILIRFLVPCAVLLLGTGSWATSSAQQTPWRLVQNNDGTLFVLTGDTRYVVSPDSISDDDLMMLNDGGSLEGQLPVPPAPQPPSAPAEPLPRSAAAVTTEHAELQTEVARSLLNFATARMRYGHVYTNLLVNVGAVPRLADVGFYRERPATNTQKHALRAPDLAVEIRSPTDQLGDQREKCRWWTAQGTRVALLVNTDSRKVELFDAAGHWQEYSGSTILPLEELLPPYGPKEFFLSADDIFAILDSP
jgi:Uma2 family endonuclease